MKLNKCTGFAFILFILLISACVKDDSTAPAPATGSDARTPFEGAWLCTENTPTNPKFTITISKDAGSLSNIKIYNINNLGPNYLAYAIVSNTSLTIPKQTISLDSYEGSGQLSSNKLSLNYKITDANGVVQNVMASCNR